MQMPEGEPHPSTLPGFRGRRDHERSVTRSWSERKKKRVEFEDVKPQDIPNPTEDNFPRRGITQLPDGVSHIYYTGKELTNRDSMRVHGTFTTVFKVWKDIATLPTVRDDVVNIFGQFMDIRLGNLDNQLIQAFTECWWPTTHTFLFPCAEIGVTPINFTILTSLSIGRYPTQVPYDDAWSILSNARQLLLNIDFSHINSGNVSIVHLKTYLTIEIHQEDDITIARTFILFMMGHLWFQTTNDTVPLGYLAAVNDLDLAAQYDWGSAILASLYHGLDTAVTTGGAITEFVQLLPYWFYKYYGVGHPIVKEEVTGEVHIPLDPPLSMLPHISLTTLHEMRQAGFVDCEQFVVGEVRETYASYWAEQILEVGHMLTDFQRMGNLDLSGPSALKAESARDIQRIQEVEEGLSIARRQIDSIDHQLYAHDLQLRRGRNVRVVPLPPGGARGRGSVDLVREPGEAVLVVGGGVLEMILSRYMYFLYFFRRRRSCVLIM
ncbi:hypothetical protein GIB67_022192 [Kingdonia uniflora]|uniref:Aminotransferase-like plant mobile domain-containing protein n=1 Tax=Kingdonia uniflora TaxID=39325 RepID=A0A7J7MW37_9MAGN|nr:hypothetical protein GIB67_022192 [Kingdonia uniflora]